MARIGVGAMVTNIIWPVVSTILSTVITGAVFGVWKSITSRTQRIDDRFNDIDRHLLQQDIKIAHIQGKLGE